MLSSAFFFLAAKLIFFLRALAPVLQRDARILLKVRLLSTLSKLKTQSFGAIALDAVHLTDRIFNVLAGTKILSVGYVVRLAAIGFSLGLLFSGFALLFLADSIEQAVHIAQKQYWWQFVLLPSLLTASLLSPLDVSCAHLLARWAAKGQTGRSVIALLVSLPVAYGLWAVGAGLAAILGLLISSGFFIPSFIWNRIVVAFFNPIGSSGSMQIGTHWLSYGLLAASSALSSFLVSLIFLVSVILKSFPLHLQLISAAPIFKALSVLDWLERKRFNYPVRALAWSLAGVLVLCAISLRLLDL